MNPSTAMGLPSPLRPSRRVPARCDGLRLAVTCSYITPLVPGPRPLAPQRWRAGKRFPAVLHTGVPGAGACRSGGTQASLCSRPPVMAGRPPTENAIGGPPPFARRCPDLLKADRARDVVFCDPRVSTPSGRTFRRAARHVASCAPEWSAWPRWRAVFSTTPPFMRDGTPIIGSHGRDILPPPSRRFARILASSRMAPVRPLSRSISWLRMRRTAASPLLLRAPRVPWERRHEFGVPSPVGVDDRRFRAARRGSATSSTSPPLLIAVADAEGFDTPAFAATWSADTGRPVRSRQQAPDPHSRSHCSAATLRPQLGGLAVPRDARACESSAAGPSNTPQRLDLAGHADALCAAIRPRPLPRAGERGGQPFGRAMPPMDVGVTRFGSVELRLWLSFRFSAVACGTAALRLRLHTGAAPLPSRVSTVLSHFITATAAAAALSSARRIWKRGSVSDATGCQGSLRRLSRSQPRNHLPYRRGNLNRLSALHHGQPFTCPRGSRRSQSRPYSVHVDDHKVRIVVADQVRVAVSHWRP